MRKNQIFIGNIKKCTKYKLCNVMKKGIFLNAEEAVDCDYYGHIEQESKVYKKNVILVKVQKGYYAEFKYVKSQQGYKRIKKIIGKNGKNIGSLVMTTSASRLYDLFVDEKSLEPYFDYDSCCDMEDISVKKLSKQLKK